MIKSVFVFLLLLIASCGAGPGRLKTLKKHGIRYQSERTTIDLPETPSSSQYNIQDVGACIF